MAFCLGSGSDCTFWYVFGSDIVVRDTPRDPDTAKMDRTELNTVRQTRFICFLRDD
jgi:hypothetical protein